MVIRIGPSSPRLEKVNPCTDISHDRRNREHHHLHGVRASSDLPTGITSMMGLTKPPRLATENPEHAFEHAAKLRQDFDLVYEYLLDADKAFRQDAEEDFNKATAEAIQKVLSKINVAKSKRNKSYRKTFCNYVREGLKTELSTTAMINNGSGHKPIKVFKTLFDALYWSFNDLCPKLNLDGCTVQDQIKENGLAGDKRQFTYQPLTGVNDPVWKGFGNVDWGRDSAESLNGPSGGEKAPGQKALEIATLQKNKDQQLAPLDLLNRMEAVSEDTAQKLTLPRHNEFTKVRNTESNFSTEMVMRVHNIAIFTHLRGMSEDDLKAVILSALHKAALDGSTVSNIHSVSKPFLMQSGQLRVFLHSQNPISQEVRDFIEADATYRRLFQDNTTWVKHLESSAIEVAPFRVLIKDVSCSSMDLDDLGRTARTMERLVAENLKTVQSLQGVADIMDTSWLTNAGNRKSASSLVLSFSSTQSANDALQYGLLWDRKHHNCEILGASHLALRCSNCQSYGHHITSCENPSRCKRCGISHTPTICTSRSPDCAVCLGDHATESERCPAKIAIRAQIRGMRFPSTHSGRPEMSVARKDIRIPPKPHCPSISHSPPPPREDHHKDFCVRDKTTASAIRPEDLFQKLNDLQSEVQALRSETSQLKSKLHVELNQTEKLSSLQTQIEVLHTSAKAKPVDAAKTPKASNAMLGKRKADSTLMSGALINPDREKMMKMTRSQDR